MTRPLKKYTVKEWKKLQKIQEILCKKYEIILTDHKTKKEITIGILDKINLKNINKGIETFNKIIQDFGDSMNQLTKELDKSSKNNIKIWSDLDTNNSKKSKDQVNLDKIWGLKDD